MPPDKRLQKLQNILKELNEGLTRDEFVSAFKAVTEYVKGIKTNTEGELQAIKTAVDKAISRIEGASDSSLSSLKKELTDKAESLMNDIRFEKEALISEAQAKIDSVRDGEDGMDGRDADEEAIFVRLLEKIPPPIDLTEKIELTREELIEKIEDLEKRVRNTRTAPFIGPSRGIFVYANGSKKGLQNTINYVGSGVTYSIIDGVPTLTITGGSGATAIEDKSSGDIDSSNLIFTFAHSPLYILVDGVAKYQTTDYTLSGSGPYTVTILEGAPTRTIRNIYSA